MKAFQHLKKWYIFPTMTYTNGSAPHGSAADADALLNLLDLQPDMSVLELGCGRAEYAIRMLNIFPSIEATGVDANAAHLATARERAVLAGVGDRLTLIEASPTTATTAPMFDAVVCIGAAGLFSSFAEALRGLANTVKPGGLVLIADGYWQHEVHEHSASRAASFYPDHASNVVAGQAAGLLPLYSIVDYDDDWSTYAAAYAHAIERHIVTHPEDVDTPAVRDRVQSLCRMTLRLSPGMLGFGWYLLHKPASLAA
jgi:cyclopropane fatty-acyl-phospholipid synthase-like methyltransferase